MRHPTKENNAEDEGAEEAEDVSDIMDDSSKDSCNFTSLLCTMPASGQGSSFIGGGGKGHG